ncbi:MAG TPA: DUF885 domain-containing protein [Candidatus Baltobacteraceae bacterium]|nr:DUF885 domain-containing protein [Candidatus Baltobacteraceae bacterium]
MKRLLCGILAVLLVGAAPTSYPGSEDDQYVNIARSYFNESFERHPVFATFAGLHQWDAKLGDFSAAAVTADLATDRAYLTKLGALDRTKLSPEVAIDEQMLENSLNDDLLLNGTLEQWKHDPAQYSQTATGSVFAVISRAYAPLDVRMRNVIAREKLVPAMLQTARKNITTVDATTQRIAAQETAGSAMFFTQTVPIAFTSVKSPALQAQLKSANAGAMEAMKSYAAWIGKLKPSGTFAIGADAYQKRLKYEDSLDIPVADYLAVGEKALAQTRAEFVATAKQIDPKHSPLQVYLSLAKDHPAPNALLATATQDLVRLRAFILAHHIITLPPDANIKVVETPPFERETTTASMDSPGPLETVATQAYYNVTPVNPKWNKKQTEEFLAQFSNYQRPIISAHEVYPGHYTNYVIDKHLPLSLTRKLMWNVSFGEGWAHYDEQMMVDEGWGNHDPRVRLAQLEEALLRECRYIVGVKMHTQGMTIPQAVDFFVNQGFQGRQVGVEESLRGSQDPMYGYYTLGKLEILKLRADYKKKLGSAYTLQKFHDALLAHGDPPIPLLRPLILGSDDDGKVLP